MATIDQPGAIKDIVILRHERRRIIARWRVNICAAFIDLEEARSNVTTERRRCKGDCQKGMKEVTHLWFLAKMINTAAVAGGMRNILWSAKVSLYLGNSINSVP